MASLWAGGGATSALQDTTPGPPFSHDYCDYYSLLFQLCMFDLFLRYYFLCAQACGMLSLSA